MTALGARYWDGGETLADRLRAHAGSSQHLYGYAMRGDDWEAGGPRRTGASRAVRSSYAVAVTCIRWMPALRPGDHC
jgi:hypothetical protein